MGTTEDQTVGWHHRPNGYEYEQALGADDGQGSLACHSPRVPKELGMTKTEQQCERCKRHGFDRRVRQDSSNLARMHVNILELQS